MSNNIHLTAVAVSRNDNHGKNLIYRMNQFVNGFIEQSNRHNLKSELILVEWNPIPNEKKLSEVLSLPKDLGCCLLRFIELPSEIHNQLENSDNIPLFQMIGKNVGIVRAQGEFVLATNIDIIFSDQIFNFFKRKLKDRTLYRADRFDVPEKLPEGGGYDFLLEYCKKNYFRINQIDGSFFRVFDRKKTFVFLEIYKYTVRLFNSLQRKSINFCYRLYVSSPQKILKFLFHKIVKSSRYVKNFLGLIDDDLSLFKNNKYFSRLHTNACGDFTLLAKNAWFLLKGYPEWNIFSWHLDSVFLYQAAQHEMKFRNLSKKNAIYHIDHEVGSGYSPEGASLLFKRLDDKKIPYLTDADLDNLKNSMLNSKEKVIFNGDDWGYNKINLPETWFIGTSKITK